MVTALPTDGGVGPASRCMLSCAVMGVPCAEGGSVDGLDSFVALGDSFTEGMDDPAPNGTYLGWADRLAG